MIILKYNSFKSKAGYLSKTRYVVFCAYVDSLSFRALAKLDIKNIRGEKIGEIGPGEKCEAVEIIPDSIDEECKTFSARITLPMDGFVPVQYLGKQKLEIAKSCKDQCAIRTYKKEKDFVKKGEYKEWKCGEIHVKCVDANQTIAYTLDGKLQNLFQADTRAIYLFWKTLLSPFRELDEDELFRRQVSITTNLKDFDAQFNKVVSAKTTDAISRDSMMGLSAEHKFRLIHEHRDAAANKTNKIPQMIETLRNSPANADIHGVAAKMRSAEHPEIIEFISQGGLDLLVEIKSNSNGFDKGFDTSLNDCFRSILISRSPDDEEEKGGIDYFMEHDLALTCLIDMFDSAHLQTKKEVVRLFTTISWYITNDWSSDASLATQKLQDGLEAYADTRTRSSVWSSFIEAMYNEPSFEFRRYSAKMIIYVVSIFDLEERVRYRNDLEYLGFLEIIQDVKEHARQDANLEEVVEEMDLYTDLKQQDQRDCMYRDLDMADPEALFNFLKVSTLQDNTFNEFRRCLHAFCAIPKESSSYVWKICAESLTYASRVIPDNSAISSAPILAEPNDQTLLERIGGSMNEIGPPEPVEEHWPELTYQELLQVFKNNETAVGTPRTDEQKVKKLEEELADMTNNLTVAEKLGEKVQKLQAIASESTKRLVAMEKERDETVAALNKQIEDLKAQLASDSKRDPSDSAKPGPPVPGPPMPGSAPLPGPPMPGAGPPMPGQPMNVAERTMSAQRDDVSVRSLSPMPPQVGGTAPIPAMPVGAKIPSGPPTIPSPAMPMMPGPPMMGSGPPMMGSGPPMMGSGPPTMGSGPLMIGTRPTMGGPPMMGTGPPTMGGPPMMGTGLPMGSGPPMKASMGMAKQTKKKKLPKRKRVSPSAKMKPFHWTKFPDRQVVKSPFWEPLAMDLLGCDVPMDGEEFEDLFRDHIAEKKKRKRNPEAKGEGDGGGDKKKRQKTTLFDSKRSYNVAIGLKNIKMKYVLIRDAIKNMDEEILTSDMISKLIFLCPTQEEVETIRTHETDDASNPNDWEECDQFFWIMRNVPNVHKRLTIWRFKTQFDEIYEYQERKVLLFKDAHMCIRNSNSLKVMFGIILSFGNYMNAGSRKGNVYAFKLSTFRALTGPKSVDNSLNLLHYMLVFAEARMPEALEWVEELKVLSKVSELDVKQLQGEVEELGKQITRIVNEIEDSLAEADVMDIFQIMMRDFVAIAQNRFSTLESLFKATYSDNLALAAELGQKSDDSLEYIDMISEFRDSVIKCAKENAERKNAEEKKAKKLERQMQLEELKRNKIQRQKRKSQRESARTLVRKFSSEELEASMTADKMADRIKERRKKGRRKPRTRAKSTKPRKRPKSPVLRRKLERRTMSRSVARSEMSTKSEWD